MSVAAKTRKCTGSTSFSVETEGTFVLKNLDETVCTQSEKRHELIQEVRGERLQGLQRARVALAIWPTHQPCQSLGKTSVWGPIVA